MKYFNFEEQSVKYPHILLENMQDLEDFISFDSAVRSKQAASFWIGFKSQKFRDTPMNYACHEVESSNTMASLMAHSMELSEKGTSLVEYCTKADKFLQDKYLTMGNHIRSGRPIRVNDKGGYCPIYLETDLDDAIDCVNVEDKEQTRNFILTGTLEYSMVITSPTIVIENGEKVYSIVDNYKKVSGDATEVQIFCKFKYYTILWKDEDYYYFFLNGIRKGLSTIVAKSTLQDLSQINQLKKVLEVIMEKFPEKTLNVYLDVSNKKGVQTSLPNIVIHYLS